MPRCCPCFEGLQKAVPPAKKGSMACTPQVSCSTELSCSTEVSSSRSVSSLASLNDDIIPSASAGLQMLSRQPPETQSLFSGRVSFADVQRQFCMYSIPDCIANKEGRISSTGQPYLMELECDIPECLELRQTPYGLGLFAAEPLCAGREIYRSKFHSIPDAGGKVLLRTQRSEHELDVHHHFPLLCENCREVNYVDSFTNHSCEPNVFYDEIIHYKSDENSGEYTTFALRDIAKGEQLTCDYDIFDWDCLDKGIEVCMCGSASCRGSVKGLKFREPDEVVKMLAKVEPVTRAFFLNDHPDIIYEQMTPADWHGDVVIKSDPLGGLRIESARGARPGDVVWEGGSFPFDGAAVRCVALGFPYCRAAGNAPPRTIVYDAAAVSHASVSEPGMLPEFFGVTFCELEADANAEVKIVGKVYDPMHAFARILFQVKVVKPVAAGGAIRCQRPALDD